MCCVSCQNTFLGSGLLTFTRPFLQFHVESVGACAKELEIDSTLNAIRHGCFGTAFAIQMRAKSTGDAFYSRPGITPTVWRVRCEGKLTIFLFLSRLVAASLIPQIYKFHTLTLAAGSACERSLPAAKTGTKNQRTHQLNNLQTCIIICERF
jgi:hypothetical protein